MPQTDLEAPLIAPAADQQPSRPGLWARFKLSVKALKHEVLALNYAVQDPRTPVLAKLLPMLALAYALSPFDLIPDFIPVLGLLDDMLLLPGLLWLSVQLIPAQVMQDARTRAKNEPLRLATNWIMATIVFLLWVAAIEGCVYAACMYYEPLHSNAQVQQWYPVGMAASAAAALLGFAIWLLVAVRKDRRKREQREQQRLQQQQQQQQEQQGGK